MTPPCVATIGTFDGLHRGHTTIIHALLARARSLGAEARVVTFKSHPMATVAPERCPVQLMPRDEAVERLKAHGVDAVTLLDFTSDVAALTASQFLELLRERLGVTHLVMGFDNSFGSDRLSRRDDYLRAASEAGIQLEYVEPVLTPDGRKISSSLLRQAYADGDIALVHECTGEWPTINGPVVHGLRNGHKLGFPTMNIAPRHPLPLRRGVYAAQYVQGNKLLPAVLNVGHNPTIADSNPLTWEVHVPGHDLGDMYGHDATVQITRFIRPEQKFNSLEELKTAIAKDIARSV